VGKREKEVGQIDQGGKIKKVTGETEKEGENPTEKDGGGTSIKGEKLPWGRGSFEGGGEGTKT